MFKLLILIFFLYSTEAWSILLVLLIQDLPYLLIRLIIIQQSGIFHDQKLFFFTIKNIFMIVVDVYRFCTCFIGYKENFERLSNKHKSHSKRKSNRISVAAPKLPFTSKQVRKIF